MSSDDRLGQFKINQEAEAGLYVNKMTAFSSYISYIKRYSVQILSHFNYLR